MKRILALVIPLLLAACSQTLDPSMAGERLKVSGASYEQVWRAADDAVVAKLTKSPASSKARGEILVGGNGCGYGAENYLGIFISPPAPRAASYTLSIVAHDHEGEAGNVIASNLRAAIAERLKSMSGVTVKSLSGAEAI